MPQRWAEALRNVEAAQRQLDDLARQLDSALYLDEEAWRQALPQAQFTAALQVGGRRQHWHQSSLWCQQYRPCQQHNEQDRPETGQPDRTQACDCSAIM